MKTEDKVFLMVWLTAVILFITVIVGFNYLGKYIPLEIALQKIKKHEYRDGYKCQEFSSDLVNELKSKGIQSEIEIGESPTTAKQPDIRHAFVGVWVEPQTGNFTNNFFK